MDEIFELKKQKDVMDRELGQKDSQLFDAKTELDKSATALDAIKYSFYLYLRILSCAVQIIEVEV
jgi:hypothetical protein